MERCFCQMVTAEVPDIPPLFSSQVCVFEKENAHRQQGTEMFFSLRCLLGVQGCAAGSIHRDIRAWWLPRGYRHKSLSAEMSLLGSDMSHSVTGLDRQYEVNLPEMGLQGMSYSKGSYFSPWRNLAPWKRQFVCQLLSPAVLVNDWCL